MPGVSTFTIWAVLHKAGYSWQRDRYWCRAGEVLRKGKSSAVHVWNPDGEAKKLIESAYTLAPETDLVTWCEDEAGRFHTMSYPGTGSLINGLLHRKLDIPVRKEFTLQKLSGSVDFIDGTSGSTEPYSGYS